MITGTIVIARPFGLKTSHPGLLGVIQTSDGAFLIFSGSEVHLVPGGPRLRIGAQVTAEPSGPYALDVQLTSPVPFP